MMLAVNRAFGKSDYLPCIAWGRNAQYAARFRVGDRVRIGGRLQSREYQKLLENGEYMSRNAFEVSVFTLEAERAPSPSPPLTARERPARSTSRYSAVFFHGARAHARVFWGYDKVLNPPGAH
jgi:single-stranded DNA-binding protein